MAQDRFDVLTVTFGLNLSWAWGDHSIDVIIEDLYLEVVLPQRPDLGLAADVPDGEADVVVLDGLHVEADGGERGDHLAQLQLVQHRGLPRVVQPDHQDPAGGAGEQAVQHRGDQETHRGVFVVVTVIVL